MKVINIIGAGMAGSILAKMLKKEGIEYRLFDAKREGAASQISENLIGESWYKNEQPLVRESIATLESLVPVRRFHSGGHNYLHVYKDDLLERDFINADCMPFPFGVVATPGDGPDFHSSTYPGFNVICAGYWSRFISNIDVSWNVGHGLLYKDPVFFEKIRLYRPFKYQKLINRNKGEAWYSDSLEVNWRTYHGNKEKYITKLLESAKNFSTLDPAAATYKVGYRPTTLSHNNYMITNGIVITGGRTQGMIRYPHQCAVAVDFIKRQYKFL